MQTIQAAKGKEEGKFRRYAPVLSGIALSGVLVFSSVAHAAKKDSCSASVQSGAMTGFHTKGKKVHIVNTPLLRAEKSFLSVILPDPYVEKLTKAAKKLPEGDRSVFVRDAVQRNIELALTTIGSEKKATFECVSAASAVSEAPKPASSAVEAPKPAPSASAPVVQPPEPAPVEVPKPAASSTKLPEPAPPKAVAEAPAPSASQPVPASSSRGRTIQPGR
jgi:hypothetical protein